MKNAIILHGSPTREEFYDPNIPNESNCHWLPWLQAQLVKADVPAATPEVPRPFEREWSIWTKEFERFDIGPETILVGHSTGAGFIIKYLSIHPDLRVNRVVLVAPWLDPQREHTKDFFEDFEIDLDLVGRTNGIVIFNSDNDEDSVHETVAMLREKIRTIQYREFHDHGHFCYRDMKTIKFPELLEEVLSEN
ncbi:MAG TPA: alpha/beta hydrolase [Candidatus Saccharimonadia bacterium]